MKTKTTPKYNTLFFFFFNTEEVIPSYLKLNNGNLINIKYVIAFSKGHMPLRLISPAVFTS